MRLLIQRVTQAQVTVEGRITGSIGPGLVVLVGLAATDTPDILDAALHKLINLRIFSDEQGKMNQSVQAVGGGLLIVSQFTLYADTSAGFRPSFTASAPAALAEPLYEEFVRRCQATGLSVATGEFGAMMQVSLTNDGPVTIWWEKEAAH